LMTVRADEAKQWSGSSAQDAAVMSRAAEVRGWPAATLDSQQEAAETAEEVARKQEQPDSSQFLGYMAPAGQEGCSASPAIRPVAAAMGAPQDNMEMMAAAYYNRMGCYGLPFQHQFS
jgi:hypothetical protein